jgi:small subunit ribosomal protein S1
VQVKVLDIDRDRQRISLGLKQTQEDPWQRVVSTYNVGDELEGAVTKVVTFGAFVEILDGVEGLVHISELAPYHVENPREIVNPGDEIRVKVLEIDSDRRRLSLSAKRVENQTLPHNPGAPAPDDADEGAGDLDNVPSLGLSEDVFAGGDAPVGVDEPAEDGEPPVRAAEEEIAPEATGEAETAEATEAEVAEADAPEAEAPDVPDAAEAEAPEAAAPADARELDEDEAPVEPAGVAAESGTDEPEEVAGADTVAEAATEEPAAEDEPAADAEPETDETTA